MGAATATAESHDRDGPSAGVPWYLWVSALAVTSAYVGGYWDISWHRSIGRDSFWSAPHIAIYACGVLAGISSAYLIFSTTFGRDASLRDVSVRIWGLRGPLGAFISAWGGVAMLVSAPFDDWWHNAYGLDVKIISPPHMVLAAGFFGIELGTVMLLLAFMNRASSRHAPLAAVAVSLRRRDGGQRVAAAEDGVHQPIGPARGALLHRGRDRDTGRADRDRRRLASSAGRARSWPACTRRTSSRSSGSCRCSRPSPSWGRCYRQVTHFIPWEFPLLLIVPAVAIDLILQRTEGWRPILRGADRRRRVSRRVHRRAVAVRDVPDDAVRAQLVLRHALHGLRHAGDTRSTRATCSSRAKRRAQFWRGMLIAALISCADDVARAARGTRDAAGEAVTSRRRKHEDTKPVACHETTIERRDR